MNNKANGVYAPLDATGAGVMGARREQGKTYYRIVEIKLDRKGRVKRREHYTLYTGWCDTPNPLIEEAEYLWLSYGYPYKRRHVFSIEAWRFRPGFSWCNLADIDSQGEFMWELTDIADFRGSVRDIGWRTREDVKRQLNNMAKGGDSEEL